MQKYALTDIKNFRIFYFYTKTSLNVTYELNVTRNASNFTVFPKIIL